MTTQNNLLPIDEIVTRAKKTGATLGHGDPKIHLAYLTKLRLLPQSLRRKINDKITGCYPEFVIPLVKRIEELKSAGLTYSQIRFQLHNNNQTQNPGSGIQAPHLLPSHSFPESYHLNPTSGSNGLTFLLIGLILGFLLATNNNLSLSRQSQTSAPPEEINSPAVKVVESNNSSNDPIYLIAIPNQNLYKLGKTNINELR